ncbi:MAG: type 4a pilus biogenesis protein PilO [Gaiellaceae bacterium]
MKKQVPVAVIVLPALLILAAVGYFLLVKPKQDAAGRLSGEIASLETQLEVARVAQRAPQADETAIQIADAFRVAKAMPDDDDLAGIILELQAVASASGVNFISIAPQPATVRTTYSALPINLEFAGNFYDLTDFLFRLRNLVSVRDGELDADGRLYSLDSMGMEEGVGGFPTISASLTLTAYYYSTTPPAAPAAPAAPASTDTTATTATTTTAPEGDAAAQTP